MYVLTIDQRGSTADRDRVPGLLDELKNLGFSGFERSVGDELQGVLGAAAEAVDVSLHALRSGHWYVGIGLGEAVVPDGGSPREGIGSAFVAARKAVDLAKAAGSHIPLSVVSGILARRTARETDVETHVETDVAGNVITDGAGVVHSDAEDLCADAQAVLRLIGRLRKERTTSQWKVVDTMQELSALSQATQKQAAERLGVSEQSVSRTLLRSGWQEEKAGRPAAARLLHLAHQAALSSTTDSGRS